MIPIHRIELPTIFGMDTVNSFLVIQDSPTLIDCGENTPKSFDALVAGLAVHGLTLSDIERVIITHSHVDHIGLASRLAAEYGIMIYVSDLVKPWALDVETQWDAQNENVRRRAKEYVDQELVQGLETMFLGMLTHVMDSWHSIPADHVRVFDHGSGTLPIGGVDWQVIYTPGHTKTQSVFYQPETMQIFGSDMLLKLAPTPIFEGEEYPGILQLLKSYEMLQEMELSTVYPGHYENFDDAHKKMSAQVNRIHSRVDTCYELIKSGKNTFLDLFQELYKGRFNLPAFNMAWAYIDMLIHQERIVKEDMGEGKAVRLKIK